MICSWQWATGTGAGWNRALALLLLCLLTIPAVPPAIAANGGVPQAVWQDNDRPHRRSPSQIKHQLRRPAVSAGKPVLPEDSQNRRAARTGRLLAAGAVPLASPPPEGGKLPMLEAGDWRLKINQAAVTNTDMVLLGDIAIPLGTPENWEQLKQTELWQAPPEEGKPLQINRQRLAQALYQALGKELAGRCILPTSIVIQRGGMVVREDRLRSYVVKSLTPQLKAMPGEAELTDFHLPDYIFLANTGQRIQLEPGRLEPGRVPVRFAVQEADGSVIRRIAGTVTLALWVTVPSAARPLGKGDPLTPDAVTFIRVNTKSLREPPWDGQGGPWRVTRTITVGEPILQSDLASQLMIRRGEVVTLIYARGNLRMSTQVEALADGEPGATIPVRNLQTKKQVFATVTDGKTVEIH